MADKSQETLNLNTRNKSEDNVFDVVPRATAKNQTSKRALKLRNRKARCSDNSSALERGGRMISKGGEMRQFHVTHLSTSQAAVSFVFSFFFSPNRSPDPPL
jgi:hypothetical protein